MDGKQDLDTGEMWSKMTPRLRAVVGVRVTFIGMGKVGLEIVESCLVRPKIYS